MLSRYESSKAIYAKYGIDTDKVIEKLKTIPVSLHCWQGDDVTGFFYPVVPKDKARIRTQMSAAHSKEDIDKCVQAFVECKKELGF